MLASSTFALLLSPWQNELLKNWMVVVAVAHRIWRGRERKGGEEEEPLVHIVRKVHWWEEYERCLEDRIEGNYI